MRISFIILLSFIFTLTDVAGQTINDSAGRLPNFSSFSLKGIGAAKDKRIDVTTKPLSLFVFLSPECPLCQNYAVILRQLREKFGDQLNCFGIIPGNAYTTKELLAFENKYRTRFQLMVDDKQHLTNYLDASVTPQAILVNDKGMLVYSGAIDDWVVGLGKKRNVAGIHYVQDAIEQSLQHLPVTVSKTKVFGCKINDY